MFTKIFKVNVEDVDPFFKIKVTSALKYAQQVCMDSVKELHLGLDDLNSQSLCWVITHIDVEFIQYPKYNDEIYVSTYPGDNLKFIYPRYVLFRDKSGNPLIKISSLWILMNKETRRISLTKLDPSVLVSEHLDGELPLPTKIQHFDTSYVDKFSFKFSDLDMNMHVNNISYIQRLIDLKDLNFYQKEEVSKLRINYLKELPSGTEIYAYSNGLNPEYFEFRVNEIPHFTAEIQYRNK